MSSFEELVSSRKQWLSDILKPWCQSAQRSELLKAELEWTDIAGKVDPVKTLWLWAWSRFPELVHESLGIEETSEVEVTLLDGRVFIGFPDSRHSVQGRLVLWGEDASTQRPSELGPFSIDAIASVKRRTIDSDIGSALRDNGI
jgi:hypothetical protein